MQYINEIVVSLPFMSNADFVHAFVYGLKQPVKGLVKAHIAHANDPPLEVVMVLALNLED